MKKYILFLTFSILSICLLAQRTKWVYEYNGSPAVFKYVSGNQWEEINSSNHNVYHATETTNDYIIITNDYMGGTNIKLTNTQCWANNKETGYQWKFLYNGSWATSRSTWSYILNGKRCNFSHHSGNQWIETWGGGTNNYIEKENTSEYILLYNAAFSGGTWIKLTNSECWAKNNDTKGQWKKLYNGNW
jgi:hypothetical protein